MVTGMKAKELRELTSEELDHKLGELKEELFNLRFQKATAQLDNPSRIGDVKKTLARVKTILHERKLEISH
jgi:large subunit ribosomal protein L29